MSFTVSFDDRRHWQRNVADRNRPQKPARRAHIIPRNGRQRRLRSVVEGQPGRRRNRTGNLAMPKQGESVRCILAGTAPGASALPGNDPPKMPAPSSVNQGEWYLRDMQEQVAPVAGAGKSSFAAQASSIETGDCAAIQRKGSGNDALSVSHGSSHLQV